MIKRLSIIAAMLAAPVWANPAVINNVSVKKSGDSYTFNVTVTHNDTGWDHYVNGWRVTDANGNLLGVRELAHPHVNEQPFTRSLSGVRIPAGVTEVFVETRDSNTGWDGNAHKVTLP